MALAGAAAFAATTGLREAPAAGAAHALASALVWFGARRLGIHYGTAILTGLSFAVAGPLVLVAGWWAYLALVVPCFVFGHLGAALGAKLQTSDSR